MMEQPRGQVLIIDDDLLIRELLELLLSRKGYEVYKASSGEDALSMLAALKLAPSTILADLQLPGIAGNPLAHRLRTLVGGKTRILAMSGSQPAEGEIEGFDGFARKPLNEDTLNNLFQSDVPSSGVGDGDSPAVAPLNPTVYARLASSMSQKQLTELYQLCLDDCRRRIVAISQAAAQNNVDACTKQAHTIKGSCGMVGATEIASLAELMESHGLIANLEDSLDTMMLACRRLEDELRARGLGIQPEDHQNARRTEA